MSNPKTKKPAKPAPAPPAPEAAYDPKKDRQVLLTLVARNGAPDDLHRAAYDALIDDPGRAELGGRTRATGVFRDAVGWAIIIDQTFRDYGTTLEGHYSRKRFAYLLDRLGALDAAMAVQEGRRGDQGATKDTAATREQAARDARNKLTFTLERYAGRRRSERHELAEAKGRVDDVTTLGSSIQALVALGRAWLSRPDAASKALCADLGLTGARITEALSSAQALTGAATDAALAGKGRASDAPEVNLVEGSVLFEMDEAMICFEAAHAATQVIPRLIPGPATKQVLGPKKAPKKSEPEEEPSPAGA